MKNNRFADDLKKYLGFLEQYGFILGYDSCNPDRPCYRNRYGEIIIWNNRDGLSGYNMEIYVQKNGWKIPIDIKKEYVQKIGKIPIGKSLFIMFRELFEFYAERDGDFFGLKIVKNDILIKEQEVPIDKIISPINPIKMGKINALFNFGFISIFIMMLVQLGIIISFEYISNGLTVFILKNILCVLIFAIHFNCIILLKDKITLLTKIMLFIFPIIILSLLYVFPKRGDYIVYMSLFLFQTIYLIINIILTIVNKNKTFVLNGLIPFIYPSVVIFVKSFDLQGSIYFNDSSIGIYFIVALIISFIAVLIFIILKKDRSDKKEFRGMSLAVFCSILVISLFTPFMTIQNINYAFDTSKGDSFSYTIIDKETSVSVSHKSATRNYYFIIIKDGEKERLSVDCVIYNQYKKGNSIVLEKHKGFLNIEYYELITKNDYLK